MCSKREVKAATSVHSMTDNAYNDLSYSAKKSNPNLPVSCCFSHLSEKRNSRFHFRFQFSYYIENGIPSSGFV